MTPENSRCIGLRTIQYNAQITTMSTNNYRKCAKCGHTPAEDESVAFHRFPKPGSTNILR